MATIKLKKLTGIQVNDNKAVVDGTITPGAKQTLLKEGISGLDNNQKIIFVGQDYKGTFTATDNDGKGDLELYLERPENHFTIKNIKIDKNGNHGLTNDGKDATIVLGALGDGLTITEEDSGWFTTGLTLNNVTPAQNSGLKFGGWNDCDLPDTCYVDISFA